MESIMFQNIFLFLGIFVLIGFVCVFVEKKFLKKEKVEVITNYRVAKFHSNSKDSYLQIVSKKSRSRSSNSDGGFSDYASDSD